MSTGSTTSPLSSVAPKTTYLGNAVLSEDGAKLHSPHEISVSETLRERPFDADPRRHFHDRKFQMRENILTELIAQGCLKETIVPTGKTNEFTITMTVSVLK